MKQVAPTEIDLVYLWVNGNDPQWVARRNAAIGLPTGCQENCEARYADSGELTFSLRSVEKYAPWIRKIFIVTDRQVPAWIDSSHPKIQIVDHTEIMPAECLPCYNSALIEHFLHHIPGLAEHFLYANDDTYINRPVTPQFFFDGEGRPVVNMNRKPLRKQALAVIYFLREKILGKRVNLNVQAVHNAARLVERHYGTYYACKPHHNIDAYRKSTFEYVHRLFPDELHALYSHRVRSPRDIHRCLYSFVDIAEGWGRLQYVSQHTSFKFQIHRREQYRQFEAFQPTLFCMNDSERSSADDRRVSINYLAALFPEKSAFER